MDLGDAAKILELMLESDDRKVLFTFGVIFLGVGILGKTSWFDPGPTGRIVAVALGLGFVVTTAALPTPFSTAPFPVLPGADAGAFRVTKPTISATPANYRGPCPVQVEYRGVVTATSGRGSVAYRFVDGRGVVAQSFSGPGTQSVTYTHNIGIGATKPGAPRNYGEAMRLEILEPNITESEMVTVEVNCQ